MFFYIFFLVLGFIFLFYKKKYSYYKKNCNLDGPQPYYFIENYLNIIFDTFANYEKKNFQKYGRTYADFLFDKNGCITTSNPEHVKKILIKDFHNFIARFPVIDNIKYARKAVIFQNEDWKRIRTQVTPVFTSGRLRLMVKKFKHPVNNVYSELNEKFNLKQNNKIEMKKLCKSFALDIIANVVFSLENNSHKDDIFSQKVKKLFELNKFILFLSVFLPKTLSKKISFKNNLISVEYFAKLTTRLVEERKKNNNEGYNDFIEMLLKSEAEQVLKNTDETGHINKQLTLEEIVGQCIVFFVAGMETISTALAYFFYELALHEDIQEKLYQDILKNYPDEELNYENLNNSKYLECVINEVLRMHVTLNRIFRKSAGNYDFGEFKIKKDQLVGISIYNLHHDPEIYEHPYKFNPERFKDMSQYSDHLFIPFSDGPRNCIGNRLAMLEMKFFIISIMKKFKVIKTNLTKIPIEEEKFVNLTSFKEMFLGFERRI